MLARDLLCAEQAFAIQANRSSHLPVLNPTIVQLGQAATEHVVQKGPFTVTSLQPPPGFARRPAPNAPDRPGLRRTAKKANDAKLKGAWIGFMVGAALALLVWQCSQ